MSQGERAEIDLDQFPEGTDEVIMSLYEHEQKGEDDSVNWMKRRLVASLTSLNKEQIRYRLNKLVDAGYASVDTVSEHNQRITYYALTPQGRSSARAINETRDVLGEIPEDVGTDDLLAFALEVAALRAEIEDEYEGGVSAVSEALNQLHRRIERLEEGLEDK